MKRYTLSFAAALNHTPEHPDRTAFKHGRGLDMDVTFQVWTNRPSLAKSVRMQQRSAPVADWKPCVPLRETEGY